MISIPGFVLRVTVTMQGLLKERKENNQKFANELLSAQLSIGATSVSPPLVPTEAGKDHFVN